MSAWGSATEHRREKRLKPATAGGHRTCRGTDDRAPHTITEDER